MVIINNTRKVVARSGIDTLVRSGTARFSTVYQSNLGRYYIGRTGIFLLPAQREGLVLLENPSDSTHRVFVVVITATANFTRRAFFYFDAKTPIPLTETGKIALIHRGMPENRCARLLIAVAEHIAITSPIDVFERLVPGNQTLVTEQEGTFILEPGHNIGVYFPAITNPDELDVAWGWWEEPR